MIETIITGDLGVNTYLYNFRDNSIVIIDPGSDEDKIISAIEKNSFTPMAILLTHGHFDHIGAVKYLKDKYSIPVCIHSDDATFLGEKSERRHKEMFSGMGPNGEFFFNNYFRDSDNPDRILNDNDSMDEFGLKVIHTPGHSPGSSCFYSRDNRVIFTGDTMFKNGMGRTDFPGGDFGKLIKSLEKLKTLPSETIVYPGHGPSSTIKDES